MSFCHCRPTPITPALPIIRYTDLDEVIERANANPNGLGVSFGIEGLKESTDVQTVFC